jgi:parallel beta-helix repeat protein
VTGLSLRGPQYGKTVNFVAQQHGLVVNAKACVVKSAAIAGFGHSGIWAEGGEGVFIDACVVEDCGYSGIMLISDVNGRITNNTIRRMEITGTGPSQNGYGIAISLVNGPVCKGTYIGSNLVEDVPFFHGIDAHSGDDILIEGNTVRRCARGLFITTGGVPKPEPPSNRVQSVNNRYELKGWVSKVPQGGQNAVAETWFQANAAKSTNNAIGSSYPVAVYNLSNSSSLTETGTTRFTE